MHCLSGLSSSGLITFFPLFFLKYDAHFSLFSCFFFCFNFNYFHFSTLFPTNDTFLYAFFKYIKNKLVVRERKKVLVPIWAFEAIIKKETERHSVSRLCPQWVHRPHLFKRSNILNDKCTKGENGGKSGNLRKSRKNLGKDSRNWNYLECIEDLNCFSSKLGKLLKKENTRQTNKQSLIRTNAIHAKKKTIS